MELLTPEFGLFFWTLLAFLVVLFILRKFAWKPILNSLSERETGIADAIASAEKVKQEMAAIKGENEQLLVKAREERSQMLKEAKEEQDRIISKAKEDTKVIADKMIAEAQLQIQQQKMAALTEVKNEVGKLSLEVAEKVLRKQLASADSQEAYAKMLAEEIKMN
ncbi:MAG: F0F1 ATP synthase subunit B [Flavipsychrobacter sp.]